MNLRGRLARLESTRGGKASAGPSVVFICDAETGEPGGALLMGGGGLTREAGETEAAFMARASDGAGPYVCLPDNGRDALAHPDAPNWAQSELVMRALRQKHAR